MHENVALIGGRQNHGYFFPLPGSIFSLEIKGISPYRTVEIILFRFTRSINPYNPKMKNMKRILVATLVILTSLSLFSCSHSVTPGDAASHHYGHCRDVR